MRVLPGVVGGGSRGRARHATALALAAAATAITLAGCAQFDAALGQRQAVVSFRANTSIAQKLAIRNACAQAPAVTPQALPSGLSSPYALEQLIYQVNQASDAQVAQLEKCLGKFPAVAGVTLQDSSDEGN